MLAVPCVDVPKCLLATVVREEAQVEQALGAIERGGSRNSRQAKVGRTLTRSNDETDDDADEQWHQLEETVSCDLALSKCRVPDMASNSSAFAK